MSNRQVVDRLGPLFGGYFHEDWDLEGSTPAAVLDKFVDGNPTQLVRDVCDAVEDLLALRLSEPETERILADAGLAYHPPGFGMSYRDFLAFVVECFRLRLGSHT
jgi:hypothetical protein